MKVLVVGSGAREHAIAWKLAQSPLVHEISSLPGNPGLSELGETAPDIDATDVQAVAAYAEARRVDLVVVGPEDPLARGLVDELARAGISAFGPTAAAAQLEASKSFAKEIMSKAGVPTARAHAFSDREDAVSALRSAGGPYVVKADGLAAGKGVLVTESLGEAISWVDRCLDGEFGEAGAKVLIEEYLEGPERSIFAICDGKDAVPLAAARDYKRLHDGDVGPNTGGMGSYSPVAEESQLVDRAMDEIIRPVVQTLFDRDVPYVGFLYAGLVLTSGGPEVLEFNVRLGDPEAQVVLPRLETDLAELILGAMDGALGDAEPAWADLSAVNVVLASEGYPEGPRTGAHVTGINEALAVPDSLVFQAGTVADGPGLLTGGGRVLSVVGVGNTLSDARATAYRAASHISWEGMQFRHDIAAVAA